MLLKRLKNFQIGGLGESFFYYGLFLLPFALFWSGIFLLIASIISIHNDKKIIFDKSNYILYVFLMFLIFVNFINYFNFDNLIILFNMEKYESFTFNKNNIWVDLFNWLPLIFLYLGCQQYLDNPLKRIKAAKYLILGTIPVLLSIFLQISNINGPFKILFNTIIWYQRPLGIDKGLQGITGLFSNQNYLACWLASIWPFSIFMIMKNKGNIYLKIISISFSIIIFFLSILTTSRNAFFGIIFTFIPLIGLSFLNLLLLTLSTILFCFIFFLYFKKIIVLNQVAPFLEKIYTLKDINTFSSLRFNLWNDVSKLISKRPFFGYGSGNFEIIYHSYTNNYSWIPSHSHNLILQIAFSYGIIPALLILFFIINIIFKGINRIFLSKGKPEIINKSWYISFIILIFFNTTDVTYYDGRFSILIWILMAGLKNI